MRMEQLAHSFKERQLAHFTSEKRAYSKTIISNYLVPYKQDDEKWREHYLEQAMKQIRTAEMLKHVKEKDLHPQYISPSTQLVAQAEAELKRQKKEIPVAYAPIKATPEFKSNISQVSTKQITSRRHVRNPVKPTKSSIYKKAKLDDSGDEDFFI